MDTKRDAALLRDRDDGTQKGVVIFPQARRIDRLILSQSGAELVERQVLHRPGQAEQNRPHQGVALPGGKLFLALGGRALEFRANDSPGPPRAGEYKGRRRRHRSRQTATPPRRRAGTSRAACGSSRVAA